MNSVYVLKRNNVPGFENIKFINNKRKPPNFKKLLTNAEIGNEKSSCKKCHGPRCECCKLLLLPKESTFKM